MNGSDSEISLRQVSAKIDELVFGLKLMLVLLTLLVSIPNFFVSLAIGRFAQIFHDVLPGQSLPLLTFAVLRSSIFLTILTFIWPCLAILNVVYGKRLPVWSICAVTILFLIGLQIFLTWIGCFLPMISLLTGMSNNGA